MKFKFIHAGIIIFIFLFSIQIYSVFKYGNDLLGWVMTSLISVIILLTTHVMDYQYQEILEEEKLTKATHKEH